MRYRTNNKRVRTFDQAWIERRYMDGYTQTAIARELGCSSSTVRKILVARRVELRRRGEDREWYVMVDIDLLRGLRRSGMTYRDIARELGVSYNTVRNRILDFKLMILD